MNQRICPKCGKPLNPNSDLCMYCGTRASVAIQQIKPNPVEVPVRKKKSKAGIIVPAVIAGVVLIVAIVLVIVFSLSPAKDEDKNQQHKKMYSAYLSETLVPQLGIADASNPENGIEGVNSVTFCDMDNDDTEEFVVLHTSEKGSGNKRTISCYTINDETEEVESIGDVELDEESVGGEGQVHLSYEYFIYSLQQDDKSYIAVERINYLEGFEYEASLFTVSNGEFVEVANVSNPNIGSDGTDIVTSTHLPDSLDIDNADVDNQTAPWVMVDLEADAKVLYYQEGAGSDYKYTTYFDSIENAIKGFFDCFGMDKNEYIVYGDMKRPYKLNKEITGSINPIYSYASYWYWNEDATNMIHEYEINDYTDVLTFYEEYESNDDEDETTQNLEPSINVEDAKDRFYEIAKVIENIMTNDFIDTNDFTYRIEDDEMVQYYPINIEGINTYDDYIAYLRTYLTQDAVDSITEYQKYVEEDGKLYFTYGGTDSFLMRSYATIEADGDGYKIVDYQIRDMLKEIPKNEYKLINDNGNYVLDTVLDNTAVRNTVFIDDKADFEKRINILQGFQEPIWTATEENYNEYMTAFYMFDIDKDGIDELIIRNGTCEADAYYAVYGNDGSQMVDLGMLDAGHNMLMYDKDGNLYTFGGHMGYMTKCKVTLDGTKLDEVVVDQGELKGDDTYENHEKGLNQVREYQYISYELYDMFMLNENFEDYEE